MNSPAKDMTSPLLTSSAATGLTLGTDLFYGREPASPDAVVSIFDSPGLEPQAGYTFLQPRVQVRIRGDKMDYDTAYTLAETIRNILHELTPQTINGTKYISVLATSDIEALGDDDNDRPSFVCTFQIQRGDV